MKISKFLSAILFSAVLVMNACSSDDDDPVAVTPVVETEITGTASAPAGVVAMFEKKSFTKMAAEFFISPLAADITGLQPVAGATVELIEIDNDGNQVGDVLATTATSITGDYTLTIPAGTSLAGNLIVRITGASNLEMRAQVVEQEVDITPISEFVLQSFIDNGADLENLTTASVIKLTGEVEEFDLTAGSDLTQMLAALEDEVGAFVDAQVDIIESVPGDASTVAGSYRVAAFDLGLHDHVDNVVGTISRDQWISELSLVDAGSGAVTLNVTGEDFIESNLTFSDGGSGMYSLRYIAGSDVIDESIDAQLSDAGTMTIEVPFEEDIDGDFGWREPASVEQFFKTKNNDLFFANLENASVRYLTVDTNEDGIKDAIDPNAEEGNEVFRGLQVLAKEPTAAANSDMVGIFGRVTLGHLLESDGVIQVMTAKGLLTFGETLTVGAIDLKELERDGFSSAVEAAEEGLSYSVAADGDLVSLGGEPADGFVNDSFDFMVLNESSSNDDGNAEDEYVGSADFFTTIGVRLSSSAVDISSKSYKILFVLTGLSATDTTFVGIRNGVVAVNSDGTGGTLSGTVAEINKVSITAAVEAENEIVTNLPLTIDGDGTGLVTITGAVDDDTFELEGYLSADGSLGVFVTNAQVGGVDTAVDELGMAVLIEQ